MTELDVRTFTVGPVAENTYIVGAQGSDHALLIDPGDEAERLIAAIDALAVNDRRDPHHAHALRPRRRGRGARPPHRRAGLLPGARAPRPRRHRHLRADDRVRPVRELRGRRGALRWRAARARGSRSRRALHAGPQSRPPDLRDPAGGALFSGDVLFAGSVGRVDLPGGDWPTLAASIAQLLDAYPDETNVYAGHMSLTTLGRERHQPVPRRAARAGCGVSSKLTAPRGTFDILPEQAALPWQARSGGRRAARGGRLRADRDARVRGDRAVRARRR
jgi:hydroxyacylglutathione hydrolase